MQWRKHSNERYICEWSNCQFGNYNFPLGLNEALLAHSISVWTRAPAAGATRLTCADCVWLSAFLNIPFHFCPPPHSSCQTLSSLNPVVFVSTGRRTNHVLQIVKFIHNRLYKRHLSGGREVKLQIPNNLLEGWLIKLNRLLWVLMLDSTQRQWAVSSSQNLSTCESSGQEPHLSFSFPYENQLLMLWGTEYQFRTFWAWR